MEIISEISNKNIIDIWISYFTKIHTPVNVYSQKTCYEFVTIKTSNFQYFFF